MIQENRWRRTRNGKNKFSADVCDGCYIISLAGELPASLPTARHTRHSLYRAQFAARALKQAQARRSDKALQEFQAIPMGSSLWGILARLPGNIFAGMHRLMRGLVNTHRFPLDPNDFLLGLAERLDRANECADQRPKQRKQA